MAASGEGTGTGGQRLDFFVSYTGSDVAWAEWLAWQLEAAGYRVVIQAWDFGAGADFVTEMRRATSRAERTLAVLSPAYVASGFAIAEWNAAFAADPSGQGRKLVPVRVVDFVPEGLDATRVYIDLVGLGETAARQRLLAAVGTERVKPTTAPPFPHAPPAHAPFPGRLPAIWNVPPRNPNFVGRDEGLEKLRAALGTDTAGVAVLGVSGLGGVGKTQLAVEHAWRRAPDYDLVWWVAADLPAAVPGALTPLAERLGVPTDDPEAVTDLLHAELARRERWLVVFDNAEDPASIGPYLPPGGAGRILITSRNPAWRSRGLAVELDVWLRDEAVAFVLTRTGSDDKGSAASVADELGLLPLALEQACAYVEETGMALGTYRDLLSARRGVVLERGTPAFYRTTVATTFGLAYERVLIESPVAAKMLETCAFLASDAIPTELVRSGDTLADEDALAVLRRLSLIRREGSSIAVHRLVADVVRGRMGPDERATRARAAAVVLGNAFPEPPADHRWWPRSAHLLPHVLAVREHREADGTELGHLLNQAGVYLLARAQAGAAYDLLTQALRVLETTYGPNHPDVAGTLGNLGNALRDLGDFAAAREHHQRALRIEEAALGPNHPVVAGTLGNLGNVLHSLGDLDGAEDSLRRALRVFEAAGGPDHPEVARTLGNLGVVLQDLGNLEGAKECFQRALRIEDVAYGADHAEVARTLGNLGMVLQQLGEFKGAEELQLRALRIKETALGPDHPEVARTLGNLAVVTANLGDPDAAKDHLQAALQILEAAFGPDHPELARTLGNLGLVMRVRGDRDAARDHLQAALRIFRAAFGPDHPEVARTLGNLGVVERDQGNLRAAKDLFEKALSILEDSYGPDHPQTIQARRAYDAL